ncbi:DUF4236 domain-containing protein [Parachryseolinea silvisoli]|uniref:DUF4236 domain-containing protein n=1 Tax=Parachryseolinea silvisoli TaxID=2873601 RepID=UPI0022659DCA|nr:DUF4236 domain-containing protein [Parachryseolinea silvisoli]MCD9015424.1 DUF4236 domain-containing protein [Parachryseolinea silvisoli]
MAWSFRKSKSFGPFRFTFSNRGLSMSAGVKGARIRFNGRGTYVTLGAGGIYYQQKVGGRARAQTQATAANTWSLKQAEFEANMRDLEDDIAMNRLTDSSSQAFVEELESKAHTVAFFKPVLIASLIAMVCYLGYASERFVVSEEYKTIFLVEKRRVHIREHPDKHSRSLNMTYQGIRLAVTDTSFQDWVKVVHRHGADSTGFIHASMGSLDRELVNRRYESRADKMPVLYLLGGLLAILFVALLVWMRRLDNRRKTMFVNYTMDDGLRELYDEFIKCFQEFASTARVWHTESAVIHRTPIREISAHRLPSPHLVINVSVPYIRLPDKELYFFPERIIFRRGRQLGAVFYKNIQITRGEVQFQESGIVPSDATVVTQRWEYLNKNGEPDRRFRDNRLLSICDYTRYTFTSGQGWNDTIMTSRTGAMDRFAEFIKLIGEYQQKIK